MKANLLQLTGRFVLMAVMIAGWTAFTATIFAPPQEKWVKLAERTANYTVDHSQIVLDGLDANLTALRVKVKKGALNLHRCAIFYKNGQTQDIDILNSIPEGGQSKVIEIPGSDRLISKLVFTYDTKNRDIQKADVELWGRQN
jgi:hypothetical protein